MAIFGNIKFGRPLNILGSITVIAVLYILVLCICVILFRWFGLNEDGTKEMYSTSVIAAVFGGAIAAGGLLSIVYASKSLSDADTKAAISSALRANELHAEFASQDMWNCRDKAWKYLSNITQDSDKLERFARMYVLDVGDAPIPMLDKFFFKSRYGAMERRCR